MQTDGRLISDLPTPAVLVERQRLDQNLRRMQERADAEGVRLRPHVKTHKSVDLARQQQALGARGLTVATVSEAEHFTRHGFRDVCVAYTVVGRDKLKRLLALSEAADVSFCVDTLAGVTEASRVFAEAGASARILVEIDVGHHRTGVSWNGSDLVPLVEQIHRLPGLELCGLLTHAGQAYFGPAPDESPEQALRRHADDERDRILQSATLLHEKGLIPDVATFTISVGSTPTMAAFSNRQEGAMRITEIRPGNYVFHDAMQVGLAAAGWSDCALTVLATVVSTHRDRDGSERVYIDAGKKVLTTDTGARTSGYGTVLYNASTMTPLPHVQLDALSEEHGWIRVRGGSTLDVGDQIRIVPNHACVVVATQQHLYLVDGEDVIGEYSVDAR